MPPRKPDPIKHCDQCGTLLQRKRFKGRLEDFGVFMRRRYCDLRCMGNHREGKPLTLNPTARTLRARARKIKGLGPCEKCEAECEVDVHHRDGNIENNALENLERLCRPCHLGEHRGSNGQWGQAVESEKVCADAAAAGLVPEVAGTLKGHRGSGGGGFDVEEAAGGQVVPVSLRGREGGATAEVADDDASPSLRGSSGGGSRQHVLVGSDEATHSLTAEGHDASEDGTGRGAPIVLAENQRGELRTPDAVPSLSGQGGGKPGQGRPVAFTDMSNGGVDEDLSPTVRGGNGGDATPRLLTEARDGEACGHDPRPDGQRYAACGDGVAAPVAHWIGLRLAPAIGAARGG